MSKMYVCLDNSNNILIGPQEIPDDDTEAMFSEITDGAWFECVVDGAEPRVGSSQAVSVVNGVAHLSFTDSAAMVISESEAKVDAEFSRIMASLIGSSEIRKVHEIKYAQAKSVIESPGAGGTEWVDLEAASTGRLPADVANDIVAKYDLSIMVAQECDNIRVSSKREIRDSDGTPASCDAIVASASSGIAASASKLQ